MYNTFRLSLFFIVFAYQAQGNEVDWEVSEYKNHSYALSKCSKEAGQSVLEALNLALDLAKQNKIQAINFGPFNKTSMKMGGNKYSDELHLMAERLNVKDLFWNEIASFHRVGQDRRNPHYFLAGCPGAPPKNNDSLGTPLPPQKITKKGLRV